MSRNGNGNGHEETEGLGATNVLGSDLPNDRLIDSIFDEKKTIHSENALDYEDFDELADDYEDEIVDAAVDERADKADQSDDDGAMAEDFDPDFDKIFGNGEEDGVDGNDESNTNGIEELEHGLIDDGIDINMDEFEGGEETSGKKRKKHLSDEEKAAKRQRLQLAVSKLREQTKKRQLEKYFPDLLSGKPINYFLYFLLKPRFYRSIRPPIAFKENIRPLVPSKVTLEVDPDERTIFRTRREVNSNGTELNKIVSTSEEDFKLIEELQSEKDNKNVKVKLVDFIARDAAESDKFAGLSRDLILSTADWDDDYILNLSDHSDDEGRVPTKSLKSEIIKRSLDAVDVEADEEDIERIFNGNISDMKLNLDMNDPNLIFIPSKDSQDAKAQIPTAAALLLKKFNISNDTQYEILENNYVTNVRSQISNLNIEHTIPALRLQSPHYKVKLNKKESRGFHRPTFSMRPGTLISFSKIKHRKRKKDKGKSPLEIFQLTLDISVTDSATLIGMEYCEEYPYIISKFGMTSKLINYYKKESEDDFSRPKAPLGETHVLGVQDRSPFWSFGEVGPGDFVPTLYNNMIRAPVYKHEKKQTDFLMVTSQGCGNHQRYYLRNIDHMFAVGDTFPALEVPAPHSRKVTNLSKNRLRMIVFRAMNKKNEARISIKDISHHFPDQNDMQNRQRLKEFMEYQRQGEDQGYWKIKGTEVVPTEEDIRTMITPEEVCLLDSMQWGQQMLDDTVLLFGDEDAKEKKKKEEKKAVEMEKEVERDGDNNEKEVEKKHRRRDIEITDMDVEEELAPWNMTRNFMISNHSKTMLQLNGDGDPSGIGIGFSFMRATQKSNFKPLFPPPAEEAPKTNTAAYQQQLYDSEIKRIWYAQRRSLVDHGRASKLDGIYKEYRPVNHYKYLLEKLKEITKNEKDNRILRIRRRVRDENGVLQRRVETITDPKLIKAYLERKKQIEDDLLRTTEVGEIRPTDDKELNKIRKKAIEEKLASLERRAKHNRGGSQAKYAQGDNMPLSEDGTQRRKPRRCALCGSFGHIKNKKTCPMYNQYIAANDKKKQEAEEDDF